MAETKLITYRFVIAGSVVKELAVELEVPGYTLIPAPCANPPGWADLTFKQCPNCPLRGAEHPQCPAALGLVPVIEAFKDHMSHEQAEVAVHTEARDFSKSCPLQEGLSSLVGLIMASSGCPVLDKLRPMVYTHLPFASGTETTYRAIATYLMGQHVRHREGATPDWDLTQLAEAYDEIRIVNRSFAQRMRRTYAKDAGINAMVILDTFAGLASFALVEQWWKEFEPLFAPCAGSGQVVRSY